MGLPTTGLAPRRAPPPPAANAPASAPFSISATADAVVARLKAGEVVEAMRQLEEARAAKPRVVRDALDRLVIARSGSCHAPPPQSGPEVAAALSRVAMSGFVINLPAQDQMAVLDEAQRHDIYASIVEIRGDAVAVAALDRGDRVILGLRVDQSTLDNRGQGSYSDRIVLLWRNAAARRASIFTAANTQPTAQYDGNQRDNPAIVFRRADGDDVTGDGVPELGRLTEGTYALLQTTHRNPRSAGTNFSLRPTPAAVAAGANRVERDTNHDGRFDASDPNRLAPLNDTFKIHSGSRANTDSAGCQTIAPGDYPRFARDVQGGSQTTWHYVLTRVQP